MKIEFIPHKYACELSKIIINGIEIDFNIKNKVSNLFYGFIFTKENPIKGIRKALFSQVKIGHYFTITKTYRDKEQAWLNQQWSGYASYADALKFLKIEKEKALQGASFSIKVKLIG